MEKFLGTELICFREWENRNELLKKSKLSYGFACKDTWKPLWLKFVERDGRLKLILFKADFSELMDSCGKDKLPRKLLPLRIAKNRAKFWFKAWLFPEPSKENLRREIVKGLAMYWLFGDQESYTASKCYRNVLRGGAHWYTNVAYENCHPYLDMLEAFGTPVKWFESDGEKGILDEFKGLEIPEQKIAKWAELEKKYFRDLVEIKED